MSKGYRSIVLALGLISLAVAFGLGVYATSLHQPKQDRYPSYRYASDESLEIDASAARPANAKLPEYRTPCEKPKGKDESDLCAQWRAAKAAEFGASWTKWGVIVGIFGSGLLLWQIILTRAALEDTSEATKAMRKQNDLVANAQRPWLSFVAKPNSVDVGIYGRLTIDIIVKNHTEFPAHNVGTAAYGRFELEGIIGKTMLKSRNDIEAVKLRMSKFAVNIERHAVFPLDSSVIMTAGTRIDHMGENKTAVYVTILVSYDFANGSGTTCMVFCVEGWLAARAYQPHDGQSFDDACVARAKRLTLVPQPGMTSAL